MTIIWPSSCFTAAALGIEIADAMDLDDHTQQLWGQAAADIAIENGPLIVDLPLEDGDSPIAMFVYG